jgi:hypothetical protein
VTVELIPADTTHEAAMVQLEIFRRMPPEQRLQLAFQMTDSLRQVAAAGVRHRHPEYNEQQVRLAVIRLTLGDQLFHEVYPGVNIEV